MMKRLAACVLSLLLLLGTLPVPVLAANVSVDWEYTLTDEEATITKYTGTDRRPSIPDELDGYPVTGIGSNAFSGFSQMTRVDIPASIRTIKNGAFSGCSGLAAVRIDSLRAWCAIEFESSSANPLSAGTVALQIKNNSTGAYQTVTDLSGLYGIAGIGRYAFYNYKHLTSARIPSGIVAIGNSAFSNCTALEEVVFPSTLERIENSAFSGCGKLTQADLPSRLESIGSNAFSGCKAITQLSFPASIETVESSAFSGCKITDVYLDDLESWCDITFPNSGSNPLNGAANLYVQGMPVTDLALPDGIEQVNRYAFYGFQGLTCVILPDSVEFVDPGAFQNCTGLKTLLIPDSDINIAASAFSGASLSDIYYNGSQAQWEEILPSNPFTATVHYNTPKYTVKITAGRGSGATIQTAAIADRPYALPRCTFAAPNGCQFKAWGINGAEYSEGNTFLPRDCASHDNTVTVTALWSGINYTLRFASGGGSGSMATETVAYGEVYRLPECTFTAPTGKVFHQWRINGVTYAAGADYTPSADATATALWTDITYDVTFDPGDGSGSMENETAVFGKAFTLPESTFTPPDGKHFKAWRIGGAEETVPAGGSFIATEDTTVTAVYADRVAISFDRNGGTGTMVSLPTAVGNSVSLPYCGFTEPDGMGFKAWEINGTEYAPEDSVTVTENLTAKAIWAPLFTVSFDSSGGSGVVLSKYPISGQSITLPTCKFTPPADKGGFKAWRIGDQTFKPGDRYTPTEDTTVFAVWKDVYTVSFVADNGTDDTMEPKRVVEGEPFTLTKPTTFTAPVGKGFKEWTDGTHSYNIADESITIRINSDMTFTAVWSDLCTVTFDAGGGSGSMEPIRVASGTSFLLPDNGFITPHAKVFKGWLINDGVHDPLTHCSVIRDATATAVWDDLFSVSFNAGGGSGSMITQTIPDGESVTLPACNFTAPAGRVFEAWQIGDVKYTVGSSYTPHGNTEVVAVWNSLYDCSVGSGETTITRYKGSEAEPAIPAILGGFPVTKIGASAFSGRTGITRITIPEGITSIGASAFSGCSKMVRVDIPSSLTEIGDNAFFACSEMTGTYITDLSAWCAISFADYDANPLFISHNLFLNDKLVEELTIPRDVTSIGSYAFYNCIQLTTLNTDQSSLAEIGDFAFNGCTGLTKLGRFPNSLTAIGRSAFSGCSALTNIEGFPNNLSSLGSSAFSGCSKLSNVALPMGLTAIPENAFSGCGGLKDVTIPESITSMGRGAFSGCSIDVVRVSDLAKWCRIEFANASSNPLNKSKSMYVRNAPVTDLTIQDEITSVSNYAFYGFQGLKCVIIPQNASIIYSNAFTGCGNLEYVMIPVGMQSLADNAFASCDKLADIYYTGDEDKWNTELPNTRNLVKNGATVHYNAKQVTVTLAPGEGSGVPEQTSAISGRPYVLTAPSFTAPVGKHFTAWRVGEQEYLRGQSFTPEESITITALWGDITYMVNFDANKGGGEMSAPPVKDGTSFILPECGFTAPTGKQFKAWQINGREYAPGEEYTPNAEFTVTAVWEPLVCVISFDADGGAGSMEPLTTNYQTAVSLPKCEFTPPEGKLFKAWKVNGTERAPGFSYLPTESVTVTAVWQDMKCTVTYESGEGSGTMSNPNPITYGNTFKLSANGFTAPTGKAFRAWEIDGERHDAGDTIVVKKDTTVTAIWADVLHISFDGNGGTRTMSEKTVTAGDSLALPACSFGAPSGMRFRCWEIGGREYAASESYTPTADVTAKAIWEPIPYQITFEAGEFGYNQTTVETGRHGQEFVLPECTFSHVPDLYFKAWKRGSTEYAPGDAVIPTANMTFTAVWTGPYLFTIAGGESTVTGYTGGETALTIPATLGGYPVTAIGASAFAKHTELTSVTIPEGVLSIGSGAFNGCTALTRADMPAGLLRIESNAFYGCAKLDEAPLPTSVISIGAQAFYGCASLTTVSIPGGMASIGSKAFYNCKALTGVYIADLAAWCAIEFADADSNPLTLAKNLYLNGDHVVNLVLPEDTELTGIGNYAFYNYTRLKQASLPKGLERVGDYAFYGCMGLTEVTIPTGTASVGQYAFSGCSALTDISLPNSVNSLGSYAFSGCSVLKAAALPRGLTTVPASLFSGCTSLKQVELPVGVTEIGQSAFSGCSALTELSVPETVTLIQTDAFRNCAALQTVSITNLAAWCSIEFKSASSNPLYYARSLRVRDVPVTDLTIQDDVKVIRTYAFNHFSGLRSVVVPQNATAIHTGAFSNCGNLECILLPEGMRSLGVDAFKSCAKLKDVYFTGTEAQWRNVNNYDQFNGLNIHYQAKKITITFVADNGSGDRQETSAISGRPYVLLGCPFAPPADQTFRTWLLGDREYAVGESITAEDDLTVTAAWTDNLRATWEGDTLRYQINRSIPSGAALVAAGYSDTGRQLWTLVVDSPEASGMLTVAAAARCRLFLLDGGSLEPLCGGWNSADESY